MPERHASRVSGDQRTKIPRDVVVVGGGPWSTDTNFPIHHTARILARDHRVLYICRDSHVSLLGQMAGRLPGFHSWRELANKVLTCRRVEQVEPNLWVTALSGAAAALPLSYPPLARRISAILVINQVRWAMEALDFARPLLWFYWWFFPEIAGAIPHRASVYDVYDDHAQYDYIREDPARQAYSRLIESRLLQSVDLVFAVSSKLVTEKASGAPIHYLPNGVDAAVARRVETLPPPSDVQNLPRPLIGYLGSFDSRFDWKLVEDLASARPDWTFVFVGGGDHRPSRILPNMHLMGNRAYPQAMRYVKSFDVALIPFVRDELTDAICPAKLFDYLSLGKPIVASALPAIDDIVGDGDEVYRADTAQAFVKAVSGALLEDPGLSGRRREIARSLTWENRVRRAVTLIEESRCIGITRE